MVFQAGWPSPPPSLRGRGSKKAAARSSDLTKPRPSAAMARADFPSPLAVPRSAGRGAGAAAQHAALRALTRCGCLSGVSAANKASSAAPPRDRASQVARSEAEGHGQWGRLFLWLLSFWRDKKKVTAPPGAHPGQQRIQRPSPSPQPSPQKGEGVSGPLDRCMERTDRAHINILKPPLLPTSPHSPAVAAACRAAHRPPAWSAASATGWPAGRR